MVIMEDIVPYLTRISQEKDLPGRKYDNAMILELIKKIGNNYAKEFLIDKDNRDQIQQMIYYFMNDKRFEGDLSKGIILQGTIGTGKSILMRIFSEKTPGLNFTLTKNFKYYTSIDIYGEFVKNGYAAIEHYSQYLKSEDVLIEWHNSIMIDELGTESTTAKDYGNSVNVMEMIIAKRYNNWQSCGQLTHFTTNLTPEEIESNYGERIRSRFAEMCNPIILVGTDRRRKRVQ